ncbi:hypothetical protein A5742_25350 [Mycolicibacterium fortuitum]|uniref:Uncharacterized protein n=1 Tax=Mycolicibacterium fortuitum TaxID=1766 RepID=A0ABD6QN69_MYCFO|nr:hypothetical protein [Mycolicibacterium fortuitum]OMC46863.1 hypothetical protein A5742_25350 [Mycolicibacterium fortuitum]
MAQQPDPSVVQQVINSRPQMPGQVIANMPLPADRAAAITLMPAWQKLNAAEFIIGRMAQAYGLNIDIEHADDGALDIRIEAPK